MRPSTAQSLTRITPSLRRLTYQIGVGRSIAYNNKYNYGTNILLVSRRLSKRLECFSVRFSTTLSTSSSAGLILGCLSRQQRSASSSEGCLGLGGSTRRLRTSVAVMASSKKSSKKEFPQGAFFKYEEEDQGEGETCSPLPCIDIGANLMDEAYDKDVEEVLQRAHQAGVKAIVITGTSVKASEAAVAFAQEKSSPEVQLFATVGVHPHDAKSCDDSTVAKLRELAAHPKCVAIGECGLDFDRNFSPPDVQKRVFEEQVVLAKELQKPLFMHCREAAKELCEIIGRHAPLGVEGVVHCFTGSMDEMKAFVDLDLHIGITGWICDDREDRSVNLSAVVKEVPQGKLMIETDAPYLTPRSIRPNRVRPWRNEPCLLPHVMCKVAQAREESMSTLSKHALQTTQNFFNIST